MKTAVIIIDFGNFENTEECLRSLQACKTGHDLTIYVVGQENRLTNEFLETNTVNIRYVAISKNGGFAFANNEAIKVALDEGADTFIILNNDTLVHPEFIDPLVKAAHLKQVGMAAAKIYFAKGFEHHYDSYKDSERGNVIWYAGGVLDWLHVDAYHWGVNEVDHGQFDEAVETDFTTGCCLAISRKKLEDFGMMDNGYFLYFEDVEWCIRAKRKGYISLLEPHSIVWHKNAGSTGGAGSQLHTYYQTRNRLLFGLRYASLRTKMALIKSSLIQYRTASKTMRMAITDGLLQRFGKRENI